MSDPWEIRRQAIERGQRMGGPRGGLAAERAYNARHRGIRGHRTPPGFIQEMKKENAGKRVELIYTDDPYTKLKPGDKGTYEWCLTQSDGYHQHQISWDNGSNLGLIHGKDRFKFIEE